MPHLVEEFPEKELKPVVILKGLTQIYENDFMGGYDGDDKEQMQLLFLKLIFYVTRYVNDFRYCSKKDCPCCPESHIKMLLTHHKEEVFSKLLGGSYGLSEVPLTLQRKFLERFL